MGLFGGTASSAQPPADIAAQLASVQSEIAKMEKNGVALGGSRHEELLRQERVLLQQMAVLKGDRGRER